MNKINFTIQHNEFGKLIIPIIDGVSLISILKEFERPFAKKEGYLKLAGGYDGIPIKYVESPSEYYLGKINNQWSNNKTVILDCPCLIIGCWSFIAKIESEEKQIVWQDFEQIHRENWSYEDLGTFTFSTREYKSALTNLEKELL